MAPRVFVTGGAGYVGGDFLALVQLERPGYKVRALVRSEEQSQILNSQFPNIECVVASPDLHSLLVAEGEAADVVVQIANSDDEAMSLALLEGVAKHAGAAYIHVSGIATLIDQNFPLGQLDTRVYSDATQTAEILSLPHSHLHAAIEQKIVEQSEALQAKLAIVSLPVMYGEGRGRITPQSKVFQPYVRAVLSHGKPFVVGDGQNILSRAHVSDASSALLLMVDEALKGELSKAKWGRDGYYFVETGESSFMDAAKETAEVLHARGLVRSSEIDSLNEDTAAKLWAPGPLFWGSNARCRGERLRALGWRPSGISRRETLGGTIAYFVGSEP